MSTVLVSAYRHGRRVDRPLPELYAEMDRVLAASFPGRFATAQLVRLDSVSGELSWVNAGHPAPLWVRGDQVLDTLRGPVTRPVGFGGATPEVCRTQLAPGDRVLFFTDGVVEERLDGGEQFGEARLRELVARSTAERLPTAEAVRQLSHALMAARDGRTSDDASLVLLEWKGAPDDDELAQNSAVTAGR
jgi:serine phosphatase RsbU (regulator of sigma subunit)